MNSTAFLSRGIVQKRPIPAVACRHLHQLTFSNFSSIRLPKKAASCHGNHSSAAQTWNGNNIYCGRPNRWDSNQPSGEGIIPNGKRALQTLLNFFVETGGKSESYVAEIENKKKQALKEVIDKQHTKAERTMKGVYQKFKGKKPAQIEYDATLALVEILIHVGTREKCNDGLRYLNDAENLSTSLPSDGKLLLYRAILLTLLDKNVDAAKYWEEYVGCIGGPPMPA